MSQIVFCRKYQKELEALPFPCLLYTSPSPRD